MNNKEKNAKVKPENSAKLTERRHGPERRQRKDVSYQYEITLDPKPERRDSKDRRET